MANGYFFGGDTCQWVGDKITFDSGDISEFSTQPDSKLPWIDGIYVLPSHAGPLGVKGTLIYEGRSTQNQFECGPYTQSFSITLIAIAKSSVSETTPVPPDVNIPNPFSEQVFISFSLAKAERC